MDQEILKKCLEICLTSYYASHTIKQISMYDGDKNVALDFLDDNSTVIELYKAVVDIVSHEEVNETDLELYVCLSRDDEDENRVTIFDQVMNLMDFYYDEVKNSG